MIKKKVITFADVQFSMQNQVKSKKRSLRPHSTDVQSSAIQWGDLSEIRDLFAIPVKLLRGPQGGGGPQFRYHWDRCFHLPPFRIVVCFGGALFINVSPNPQQVNILNLKTVISTARTSKIKYGLVLRY